MDDWHAVVLAAVRLGCNFDDDKLHDPVENHSSRCRIMEIGDWEDAGGFTFRRIHDTLCQLKPITLSQGQRAGRERGTLISLGCSYIRSRRLFCR